MQYSYISPAVLNIIFLNQARAWFLEIVSVRTSVCVFACVCVCVCVCVCMCVCARGMTPLEISYACPEIKGNHDRNH